MVSGATETHPLSFGRLLVDIRALQKSELLYSPLDRAFASLLASIPPWLEAEFDLSFYGDRGLPVPEMFGRWRTQIGFTRPIQAPWTLVVERAGMRPRLRDWLRAAQDGSRYHLLVTDRPDGKNGVDLAGDYRLFVDPEVGGNTGTSSILPPLYAGFGQPLDQLEQIQLEALLAGPPLVLIDSGLLGRRGIGPAIKDALRSVGGRPLILGRPSIAMESREFPVLLPSPALLARLIAKAEFVLVSGDGPAHAVSVREVVQLGGRCIRTAQAAARIHLDDALVASDIAAGDSRPEDLWRQILGTLPARVRRPPAPRSRPRIAFVSTMFPQPGGPPRSSQEMVAALSVLADVEVWTDAEVPDTDRARLKAIHKLHEPLDRSGYDEVFYVLGNHPMHIPIYDKMRRNGGTLILHDAHMMDFLLRKYGEEATTRLLSDELGEVVTLAGLQRVLEKKEELQAPFLQEILRHAHPVVVHSRVSAEWLERLYGTTVRYLPVPMPYSFAEADLTEPARATAKARLGIDPARPCIASFGEVHLSKGAKQFIFAMQDLRDWGYDAQFLFVGPVDEPLRELLEQVLDELGLKGKLRLVGRVSEADYADYLKAVDIGVQIRAIPFGQVSGALLDENAAGMWAVASQSLADSIDAAASTIRLADQASPLQFAEKIADLLDSGAYRQRPGPGWHEFVRAHSFQHYARDLLGSLVDDGVRTPDHGSAA
jgi:glycosyltransferase involved in cell wall biosynthesis